MQGITILKSETYDCYNTTSGIIKYENDLIGSYLYKDKKLFINFADGIDTIYKNIKTIVTEELTSFFMVDECNTVLNDVDIYKIYKRYLTFEEVSSTILLCNEYIGYYDNDTLEVTLLNNFGRNESSKTIRELLYFYKRSDNISKFNDGIKIQKLKCSIKNIDENRILLYIEDDILINNKYKYILVKNKDLYSEIVNEITGKRFNLYNNIIILDNLILKYYSDNVLLLGNIDNVSFYGYTIIDQNNNYIDNFLL